MVIVILFDVVVGWVFEGVGVLGWILFDILGVSFWSRGVVCMFRSWWKYCVNVLFKFMIDVRCVWFMSEWYVWYVLVCSICRV